MRGQHEVERVRHDARRRTLAVETVERLGPGMLRICFRADRLDDFVSLSADDHVKLFFQVEGGSEVSRDYTPRRFDVALGTVVIDFAVHDAGVATDWAVSARVGSTLDMGGPRGSTVIPADFDWYWLIGDETGLPAIGRWLEEATAGAPITTFVIVGHADDRQVVATAADWTPVWVVRTGDDDAAPLRAAMAAHATPPGDGFVWIAAEAQVARTLRDHMLRDRGHLREWMKAGGYWVRGRADAHDRIAD